VEILEQKALSPSVTSIPYFVGNNDAMNQFLRLTYRFFTAIKRLCTLLSRGYISARLSRELNNKNETYN
jgi:hypothetical protein